MYLLTNERNSFLLIPKDVQYTEWFHYFHGARYETVLYLKQRIRYYSTCDVNNETDENGAYVCGCGTSRRVGTVPSGDATHPSGSQLPFGSTV